MAAVLGLGFGVGRGQQDQNVGKRVGDKVDSAVQDIKRGAKDLSEGVKEQFNKMRASVHDMGVASRVYSRIHWDKGLQNASIEVHVRREGVATLRGTVADATAKAKAVHLAADTVGVNQVVDELSAIDSGAATTTKSTTPRP
jgi:osmotically-inducible protein OsmY